MLKVYGVLAILLIVVFSNFALASKEERAVMERYAAAKVTKDIGVPFVPADHHKGRSCADGRDAANFNGDVLEFWGDMECRYCGIREVVKAQREHPELFLLLAGVELWQSFPL